MKEARLRDFHEGPRLFDQDHDGFDDGEAWRSGFLAVAFFVAFSAVMVFYGGKVFGWICLVNICLCTLVTSLGGFDTLELWWSRFSIGTPIEKQD